MLNWRRSGLSSDRGVGTISSITLNGILKRLTNWQDNTRLFVAAAFLTNCFWILALAQTSFSLEYIPWLVALTGVAFTWLIVLLPAKPSPASFAFLQVRQDRGLSLSDWMALTYSAFSLAAVLLLLQIHRQAWHPLKSRQVIDIQFTSFLDYQDKKELLPATEPRPTLRKRHGSTVEQTTDARNVPSPSHAIQLARPKVSTIAARELGDSVKQTNNNSLRRVRQDEPVFVISDQPKPKNLLSQPAAFKTIAWPTRTTFLSHNVVHAAPAGGDPIQIEEVAPAKLLEVTDNDGDGGAEVWQAGGRSQGGKGARSLLANYLKELHKRLKRAWSPPIGTSSGRAEILFRLKRDGQLCSIKLATSSGDPAVDDSAMTAISTCAPYAHLPAEYPQEYLDLRYTFNYTADELKAVDALTVNSTE
ncbi:MAG: hypothetical protein C5B53_00430 [Candidatus Melainabacteria bacterium]|nr:MAG: hypothetical protein C5B53_00430 [Candidatus Melainabacteria bacterium]